MKNKIFDNKIYVLCIYRICGDNIIMLELYWKIFEDGRKFSLSRKRFYDGKNIL
jgi:hypothetical protein